MRKTDDEITIGQKTLFNEIVTHGNQVILTYNQFVDSRGFFSLLKNENYYNSIIKLFEAGAIKISQYKDIRTLSQYIINNIENDDKEFIYSALPLKGSQKRLAALVKRSLMYSDLTEIKLYIDHEDDDELKDLFIEVKNGKIQTNEKKNISIDEKIVILKNLYSLLSIVLRLSPMENIYLPPRVEEEYEEKGLKKFIEIVTGDGFENGIDMDKYLKEYATFWNNAIGIICEICKGLDSTMKVYPRSVIVRKIIDNSSTCPQKEKPACKLAEAIVNICYNYTCEASICDISKHYDFNEIDAENSEYKTFKEDFFNRLRQHLGNGDFLQGESNDFVPYEWRIYSKKNKIKSKIPDFEQAVRTYALINSHKKNRSKRIYSIPENKIPRYEYKLNEQNRTYKVNMFIQLLKRLLTFIVCIGIAIGINFGLSQLEEIGFNFSTLVASILVSILFLALGECITWLLSKIIPGFLQLSEAVEGFVKWVKDVCLHAKKLAVYSNKSVEILMVEDAATSNPIDYYETKELKRYRKWKANNQKLIEGETEDSKDKSNAYTIAELEHDNIQAMMRGEELYNYKFGIPYESKYSVMVVDPIIGIDDKNNEYIYPYERLAPTTPEAGVVAIARQDGKFILLDQYRHALRKNQYSFPRGFANKGQSLEDCVKQELREEIKAVIKGEPIELGKISPDSGITSKEVTIFLVDIESSEANVGHEGIKDLLKVSLEDLEKMIKDKKINDGYTLGAYALYKQEYNE